MTALCVACGRYPALIAGGPCKGCRALIAAGNVDFQIVPKADTSHEVDRRATKTAKGHRNPKRARKSAGEAPRPQGARISAMVGSPVAITLPEPPSVNHYWRHAVVQGRVRVYLSGEGKKYKAGLETYLATFSPVDGPIALRMDWYRSRRSGDLDNRLKVTLDVLTGAAYHDDKQIVSITARRFDDASNPRVEVEVTAA